MAARQPRTPGATEAIRTTETEVVTSTAANADANLDAILGTAETPDSNVGENTGATEATSTVSEPVAESSLSEILETQKRIETKLDQLLVAGGIEAPKKKRWVQGENSLEHKEI